MTMTTTAGHRDDAPGEGSGLQQAAPVVLDVRGLSIAFHTHRGVARAVTDVSFDLRAGETLGLVGESGSGKSTTLAALLGMVPAPGRITEGEIAFEGRDLTSASESALRAIRGNRMALVPQDASASLNPLLPVGRQIEENLSAHGGPRGAVAQERVVELLDTVGIPAARKRAQAYPHELSGGMRQRVMIAMAIANDPVLLLADEPTTALDATVQAQVLELLKRLSEERSMATILVTHNLGIVAGLCDDVAVMYAGRIVEQAPRDELFARPRHPYTEALLRCVPRLDRVGSGSFETIPGQPPDLIDPPGGCPFAPRCTRATDRSRAELPPLEQIAPAHRVACWNADVEAAPR